MPEHKKKDKNKKDAVELSISILDSVYEDVNTPNDSISIVNEEDDSDEDYKGKFILNDDELMNPDIKKNHVIDFFRVIERGVRHHGVEKITSVLKNLDIQSYLQVNNLDVIVKYVCECVAKDYKKDKVKEGDFFLKKKRGEITSARKMAIILIKESTNISDTKLARYFGRSRQIIFYTLQEFKDLNPTNKHDVLFLNRYDKLSRKIALFIKENNLK
jgi:hypothetical protein